MRKPASRHQSQIDRFFAGPGARADQWQNLAELAEAWSEGAGEYSMYGAVPLRTIKQALLDLKADGRLNRAKMVDLTNCTFDGHIYNTRRVMEECLAIKPDLIFLWDEAWFGFARFSPFLRPRTAMGAANDIEAWLNDPKSVAAYEKQQAELGADPGDDVLLSTRLIPDPRKVKLRVYQTNSTHKSMSALRQGSMLLVKDVDF